VKSIASILDEKKYPFKLYTNQGIFVASSWTDRMNVFLDENPEVSKHLTSKEYKMVTEQPKETDTLKLFDHIDHVLKLEGIAIQKFFIPTISGKTELTSTIEEIDGISVTTSGPFNIEIMDTNGHKGNGIRVMAEYFNIPIENTVAIGDNFNDVPMLKTAGLSIAMENGDPAVKEIADVVTLTNNEHGVAHAIEKYVLANS
jgi:Cof subfamily protein (haloacid dehalogenase superfamily)